MSIVQDRNINNDIAAAGGDLVRGASGYNASNPGNPSTAGDANLAAQLAPIVLTSLRTFTQQRDAQGGYVAQGQGTDGGHAQIGQQVQQGHQAQHGIQAQQYAQQGAAGQPGSQTNGGGGQAQRISSRGTLAAVVTPIVAEALTRYVPAQNAARGSSGPQPVDRNWLDTITGIVADVAPAVVDALKTSGQQPGAQRSAHATHLAAEAQRGTFDDLTNVVAAAVPSVLAALKDYQPASGQAPQQRAWSDDAFNVARLAAPIAIAAL